MITQGIKYLFVSTKMTRSVSCRTVFVTEKHYIEKYDKHTPHLTSWTLR